MRSGEDPRVVGQRAWVRFAGEHIQAGAVDLPGVERRDERGFVDEATACDGISRSSTS